ncbi:MAG: hypothetical protein V1495_04420 [Pseudomonadota bacterium]
MNFDAFADTTNRYSIVLFIQSGDLERKRREIERLGEASHVKLVVQPCPFEGIEFLYRAALELPGQEISIDQEVYWHALVLTSETPEAQFNKISDQHYEYLLAILEQDAPRVLRARKAVESLAQNYLAS